LNNIAAKDPKKAKELFERLREFMAELRTCWQFTPDASGRPVEWRRGPARV